MNSRSMFRIGGLLAVLLGVAWFTDGAMRGAAAHDDHDHAEVPADYAKAEIPDRADVDPTPGARGPRCATP